MRWFRYGACLILFLSLFFLPEANQDYLFLQSLKDSTGACFEEALKERAQADRDADEGADWAVHLVRLDLVGTGPEANAEEAERALRQLVVLDMNGVFISPEGQYWSLQDGQIRKLEKIKPEDDLQPLRVSIEAEKIEGGGRIQFRDLDSSLEIERTAEFFQWYSILPPFVAILLALLFQRTLLALFAGVWLGATLLEGMNPLAGLWRFIERYFIDQALTDWFRVDIIGFVIALCATVGVLTRGGGIQGFVDKIVKIAKTVRSTQFATYLMGLGIFFDDYANCIIVGNTLRPLTDRMKISREKLSYIVDSTAAPVAGLSMLSTWIAYEVSTFSAQLPEAGIQSSAYEIFFRTLPFRFYCIFTLAFIAFQILLQRDFGPMLKAERRSRSTGAFIRPEGKPLVSAAMTKIKAKAGVPARWYNAVLPILCILVVTVEEMWRIGGGWNRPLSDILSPVAIREVLGNAADVNSAKPIFIGAIAGFVLAVILMLGQRILGFFECMKAAALSTKALFFAIAILIMAWCIGGVCSDIGTAHYLIALFKGVIDPVVFPTLLFITSCLVAFATGSSWSTMAILLPNTVILSVKIGELSGIGPEQMLVISIGAVLEGSIFGDHCSPISDTTILSSVSTASDHMDHIKTQAPYAIVTMTTAILAGYIPAVLGCHPGISLLAGGAVLLAFLLLVGRRPELGDTIRGKAT